MELSENESEYAASLAPSPDLTSLILRGPFSPITPAKSEQPNENQPASHESTENAERDEEDAGSYAEDGQMLELEKLLGIGAKSDNKIANKD